MPSSALYVTDDWAAGAPLHAWCNYGIVSRQRLLAGVSSSWNNQHPNWERSVHGGPQGWNFCDGVVKPVPEASITEADLVEFKRAPVGKKCVWFDARDQMPITMVIFDCKSQLLRPFDGCYSLYEDGDHFYWLWSYVHAVEFRSGGITRLKEVGRVTDGHGKGVNNGHVYEEYLTRSAITALGWV